MNLIFLIPSLFILGPGPSSFFLCRCDLWFLRFNPELRIVALKWAKSRIYRKRQKSNDDEASCHVLNLIHFEMSFLKVI